MNIHRRAETQQAGRELDPYRVGHVAHLFAPPSRHFGGPDRPLPGRHEFDVHLSLVRRRDRNLEPGGRRARPLQREEGLGADRRHHMAEHAAVTLAPQLLLQLRSRRLDALDRRERGLRGRPLGHGQQDDRVVSLHLGEELELDPPGHDERGDDHKHRQFGGDGGVPPLEHAFDQGPVDPFDHPFHLLVDEPLEARPTTRAASPLPVFAAPRQEGQVMRQHQHRLDQREGQTADDDQGNRPGNRAYRTVQGVDQGRESRRGRKDGERDRRRHLSGAVDCGAHPRLALLEVTIDVLPHHDRVVDHDPEHEDEGERRLGVDRHRDVRQHGERAHERDRDADRDPQRQPKLQEQGEHQKHEQQAQAPALQQYPQPVAQRHRVVEPGRHSQAGRQGGRPLGHESLDLTGDAQRTLVAGPVDLDQGHRLTVEARRHVRLGEAVRYAGDVAQHQPAAVGPRAQHDVPVLLAPVRLTDRAQEDLALAGSHGAARKVEGGSPDRQHDVVEGQAVPPERVLRNLDRDLVRPYRLQLDLGDVRKFQQTLAHLLRDRLESPLLDLSVDRHGDHAATDERLLDDRLLGLLGKGRDRVDPRPDLVQ